MKYLANALYAEHLKTKRTLAFWLAIIAPAVIIGLQMVMVIERESYYRTRDLADGAWTEYAQSTMVLWALLMLPLFVTLETALIGNWEHKSQQWKHLFALPIPRGSLYAAKQICGMLLIGLSSAALVALTILSGWSLRFFTPGLGFEYAIPVLDIIEFAGYMFLGSWLIIATQTWVAQRWPSFAIASGVGIAMTIIGAVVIQSDWAGIYPYVLPILVASGFSKTIQPMNILPEGVLPMKQLLLGSVGGLFAAMIGGWNFARRDVL